MGVYQLRGAVPVFLFVTVVEPVPEPVPELSIPDSFIQLFKVSDISGVLTC